MEEMKQDFQADEEFSLGDIFRALWSKILILLLVLVLGATAGGLYGYLDSKDVYTYGVSPVFYVNPDKNPEEGETPDSESQYGVYGAYGEHVMKNMIELLSSETFSAQLMQEMPSKPAVEILNADGSINQRYAAFLRKINDAVSFSYTKTTEDGESSLSKSFIYVKISVTGKANKAFAEELLRAVEIKVPEYVEKYMVVPSGYDFTNCVKTTVLDEVHLTNAGYAKDQAIKFAILLGAAALLVSCIVVVIAHRMDNRLRHYESVSKRLGVPVLGVLPSIDKKEKDAKAEV
ncbi:MAG: hypothetical protein IJ506_03375 [Clostridia bacterium]|nr:hypothetical protein [Clostridia bacterium]